MTNQEEINYMIHLLKCAVSDETPQIPTANLDWDFIFQLSLRHRITSTFYFGIKKLPESTVRKIPHMDAYISSYKMNLVSDANRAYELERLQPVLIQHNIDYMFLKGSVIKNYYPDTSMRYMNDMDILFRGADFKVIDHIFEDLGYEILHKDAKDTAYKNPINKVVIEMQPHLIDMGYTRWYDYLEKMWEKCTHKGNAYEMSQEDFYIYHIIHMAKHFLNGGIGLIHMIDVYIMLKNFQIDLDYVNNQLKEIGLIRFQQTIRLLIRHWFSSEDLHRISDENMLSSEEIKLLTKYILRGGAFGSRKQQEINHIVSRGDEKRSIRKKLFPNMTIMVNYYGQSLRRYPFLLPFYWIRLNISRLLHLIKESKTIINNMNSISEKDLSETKRIMDICGL